MQNRVLKSGLSRQAALKAVLISAAASATLSTVTQGAGVDQFQFYFDQTTSQGGTNGIGGYTYDSTNNVFWTVGFTGTSQAIRKISNSGTWTGTPYVGQTAWLNQYLPSTSLSGAGTVPAAPWAATNAVGNIKLNPASVTVNGITYAPGTLGVIVDQSTVRDGLSPSVVQPAYSKQVYVYDLRQVGSANTGRDRNTNGLVDWNDVFDTISTLADQQAVQTTINGSPVTGTSSTIGRSFAFSSDGQSVYYNDSASTFGGIWKASLTSPGTLTKVVQALTGNRINTEPDVVPSTLRNFGGGTGDQVLFQGATDTGNDRGLSYIVDNGTNVQTAKTLLTAKQMASFLDNGAQPDVGGITHDASGNIFITMGSAPNGAFVYDANGRLAKVFSAAEKRVFDSANGMTGTTYNSLILDMSVRNATVNLTGGGTTSLTQLLFTDSTTGARFPTGANFWKVGDFNRDNVVDATDIALFKTNLGLRGATAASITGTTAPTAAVADKFKYDLNGDTVVTGSGATAVAAVTIDWRDVKVLQQYAGLSDGDVDMNFTVDSTDLSTIGANYNGTGKLFTQGNLTSVRYSATDKDTVNFADLITLAANWTAAKPALAAVGSISSTDIDRAFAITSGGTLNQLTNTTGGSLTWSTAGNWSAGVPNGTGAVVSLLTKPFNDTNLNVDASYTLGQLNLDSYFDYTLSGSGTLHFNNGSGTAEINLISAANPVISAGVAIDTNTNINQTYSTDTFTLSGPLSIAAGKTLTKTGGSTFTISGTQTHGAGSSLVINTGTLNLASDASNGGAATLGLTMASGTTANITAANKLTGISNSGTVNVSAGTSDLGAVDGTGTLNVTGTITAQAMRVRQGVLSVGAGSKVEMKLNGGASGVSAVNTFTLNATGKVELHDNDLVINYAPGATNYTAIVNNVKAGLTLLGGAGTSGIGSTEVDAQTIQGTILAVVDDGDANIAGAITATSGYTIPAPTTSTIVKFTWFGDSNLDGQVDGSDYALLDSGFTSGGSLGGWVFGDYDYSGVVDGSDYALIDTGFISQNAVLPEPTTLGLLGLGAVSLIRRRRAN